MTSAKRKEFLFLGGVFALAALILFLALPGLLAIPAVTALLLVYLLDAGFTLWAAFLRRFGRLGRTVGKGLFGLLGTVVALGVLIYTAAPAILFQPHADPEAERWLAGRQTAVQLDNGLCGYLRKGDGKTLLLYFSGNQETAASRLRALSQQDVFPSCDFACIDYPAYGRSSGSPTNDSLLAYGLSVYDYFSQAMGYRRIILMGYSLGTGVANYVASQRDPLGLILMAPYAGGCDLYNRYLPIFYGPLRLLVAYPMPAADYARQSTIRPLILASEDDETVPYQSSARLSRAYPQGCELTTLHGVRHNDFWQSSEVLEQIQTYLNQCAQYGCEEK